MISDKGLATFLSHLQAEGGRDGGKKGGQEVWLQLRKEYAVLLRWEGSQGGREGASEEGKEGGGRRGRVSLYLFRPGVIRDWDQRPGAMDAAREEERVARGSVVVEEGGEEGEEGGEVQLVGWGVRLVPPEEAEGAAEGGKGEGGLQYRQGGNGTNGAGKMGKKHLSPIAQADPAAEEEVQGGVEGTPADPLLHLALRGSFIHPLHLSPCPTCGSLPRLGFYRWKRTRENGGYKQLGPSLQALPLRVRQSLPLVTPFCPQCDVSSDTNEPIARGGREGQQEREPVGREEEEAKRRVVYASYRFLGEERGR